jgi:hypothetical protein
VPNDRHVVAGAILAGCSLLAFTIVWASGRIVGAVTSVRIPMQTSARSEEAAARAIAAPPSAIAASASPPNHLPAAISSTVPASADELAFTARAQDELRAQQPIYRKACWKDPAPGEAIAVQRYDVQLSFDGAGTEVGREIRLFAPGQGTAIPISNSSVRGAEPELFACVRKQTLPPLRIASPGKARTASATFFLP